MSNEVMLCLQNNETISHSIVIGEAVLIGSPRSVVSLKILMY